MQLIACTLIYYLRRHIIFSFFAPILKCVFYTWKCTLNHHNIIRGIHKECLKPWRLVLNSLGGGANLPHPPDGKAAISPPPAGDGWKGNDPRADRQDGYNYPSPQWRTHVCESLAGFTHCSVTGC